MHFAGPFVQVVYIYGFDPSSGEICNRRIFAEVPLEAGMPDGITVDCECFVWNGHWRWCRLTRYDPSVKIEREVHLPVQYVTNGIFDDVVLNELCVAPA